MNPLLRSALDAIEAAAGGLPADVLARPVPGRWSIAQILEHLTLAFTRNAATLEKVLASGELRARPPIFKQRLARMLVVNAGYFPKVRAPEGTTPSGSIPPEQSVAAVREALLTLDDALARVAARFGADVAVANHPYFAGLSVRQWQKFHWRHTVHHMKQVRAAAGDNYSGQIARRTAASR